MFEPSRRFVVLHGEGVSRRQAERILGGILYGHDTVPDLVTLTCELSVSMRRGLTFSEAASIASIEGARFDGEGWVTEARPDGSTDAIDA